MATANSKYDLAPIQSSYVNDGGQDVAGLLRQRYDANKQKYDMIERTAKNLDVLGGDQHHKDGAIQGINDGIAGVARRGNYESAGADIDELANSFATNQALQASSDSYTKRQEELARQANITAQGGQIVDFGNMKMELSQGINLIVINLTGQMKLEKYIQMCIKGELRKWGSTECG